MIVAIGILIALLGAVVHLLSGGALLGCRHDAGGVGYDCWISHW